MYLSVIAGSLARRFHALKRLELRRVVLRHLLPAANDADPPGHGVRRLENRLLIGFMGEVALFLGGSLVREVEPDVLSRFRFDLLLLDLVLVFEGLELFLLLHLDLLGVRALQLEVLWLLKGLWQLLITVGGLPLPLILDHLVLRYPDVVERHS